MSWTTDLEYDEDAVVDIYLTEDGDALERIKTSSNEDENSLGTSVARVELDKYKSGNCKVVLPDTLRMEPIMSLLQLHQKMVCSCNQ